MERLATFVVLANLLTAHAAAQQPVAVSAPAPGLDASISMDANGGGGGTWLQLTPGVGYTFNPRWSIEVGVPVYYLSAGATNGGSAGLGGVGDVYGSVSLDMSTNALTFYTTLTASAPTGSVDKGLGAGQTSWDWTGHLAGEFGRFGPYVNGGVGNNVKAANESLGAGAGTSRPGTGISIGNQAHVETGLEIGLWKSVTLTASGYGVFGFNGQSAATPLAPRPGLGLNRLRPANPGGALLARSSSTAADTVSDHGVGLVLWAEPTASLSLSLWLSHSIAYPDYTTVSVSSTWTVTHRGKRKRSNP